MSGIVEYSEKQYMQCLKAWAPELDHLSLFVDSNHFPEGWDGCLTFPDSFCHLQNQIGTQFLS